MHEASYYHHEKDYIICDLCPHKCIIKEGSTGFCRTRLNKDNVLYAENYGMCTSIAIDPIEKKPLYQFYPGHSILSVGTWGCNFSCKFCQNYKISQQKAPMRYIAPQEITKIALSSGEKNIGLAYTYSEPLVWYEYVYDTAPLIHKAGLKNVLVTNGFINSLPFNELLPLIDAVNIDLKAFNNDFYSKICSGDISFVKENIKAAVESCHTEITTLIIPGLNDNEAEIASLSEWLASLDADIPLHLSRYFPNYKMKSPPTPIKTMYQMQNAAQKYLKNVYLGNMPQI